MKDEDVFILNVDQLEWFLDGRAHYVSGRRRDYMIQITRFWFPNLPVKENAPTEVEAISYTRGG